MVPQFYGVTQRRPRTKDADTDTEASLYLELQCCLTDFSEPSILDVKMGVRTFLETEVRHEHFYITLITNCHH